MNLMKTKIILAENHKIVREGLCSLINRETDMEVAAEAENGRVAKQLAEKVQPDVIIMDVSMPEMNGIEATRQITGMARNMKVIALSVHSDKRFVRAMLEAGARGYLTKDCAFKELVSAVRIVMENRYYLSPSVSESVLQDYIRYSSIDNAAMGSRLTDRELEVLQLIAEGNSTKQIASCLQVSVKTIETHRRQVMDKLKIYNVAELTKYAIREGITSIDA